jgi:hypothetical protein
MSEEFAFGPGNDAQEIVPVSVNQQQRDERAASDDRVKFVKQPPDNRGEDYRREHRGK